MKSGDLVAISVGNLGNATDSDVSLRVKGIDVWYRQFSKSCDCPETDSYAREDRRIQRVV